MLAPLLACGLALAVGRAPGAARSALAMSVTDRAPDTELLAPGKVNLFLRILRRREDGYHELASLFQAVSLADTLRVWRLDPAEADRSTLAVLADSGEAADVPVDDDNLALRAVRLFEERAGVRCPVHMELTKRIPVQAGMGGGSADAAAALFAANRIAGYPASMADLALWGGDLGSDISFFFSSGTAYCTGRGEQIESLAPFPAERVMMVKPKEGLSTGLVYKTLDLQGLSDRDPEQLLAAMRAPGGLADQSNFINDLEPPALAIEPRLAEIKASLKGRGWKVVLMSGSGTSIFCLGPPDGPPLEGWQEDLGAACFQASFVGRDPSDDRKWYGE